VAGYRKELISQLEARETELGETDGTLKEPELQRLVAQTKNGTAMLESAAAATRDARRNVESTRQLLKSDAFAQLEKDLAALVADLP
jgi:negative regulator of replication initiation